ncbi:MAG: hypothetical protein ACREHG_03085, partial [Candidatus Saccharimonadales bacterium]
AMNHSRATEAVIEHAESMGLIVVFPQDNEIQIDLDNKAAVKEFRRRLGFFKAIHGKLINRVYYTHSRSGGTHVTIQLTRPVESKVERIMFQALLGSDAKREMLSLMDLFQAQREPTLFYEKEIPASQATPGLERFVKRVRKAWHNGQKRKISGGRGGY